jgi:hypothetical protein
MITEKQLEDVPISFCARNQAWVMVGPCSKSLFSARKIPLDGRKYVLGGEIILQNGMRLSASFDIDTTVFDFLVKDSVWVHLEDAWYRWDEPELLTQLKIAYEEAFPFTWIPDIPLAYSARPPYKM